ncbi:hypothetical protein MesoLjLc_49460 [Mesorhizobium sp. L-8-10]|uniref:hypothetical protein n=1 Tax=Mesorhizobium sp. L-8-10 TaxID=2744523 RepID=UPI0019267E32|nr:hypothetical protein [Mesorhizobium sp. L-8-10]BCH33016.1 hypothetical protein MesoLjLc_49460 [Mesorhizobium sp. L-8-10]
MASLSNGRHEAFAIGLAEGMTADQAYVEAGFRPNRGNACRLKSNESIRARVRELLDASAEKATVTITTIATQLDEDRALAHAKGQASAAVAASMAKARLYGLLVDKVEATVSHSFSNLSDQELDFEIAALVNEMAPPTH